MRQKILVTGGAGYVGRTLIRQLYNDHDVCVVDMLRFGLDRFNSNDINAIRLEALDLRDGAAVDALMADFAPDVIVHLAAIHYIPECENDPQKAVSTNVTGTVNLLHAAPEGSRFVFASSGAVYAPDEALHKEDTSAIAPSDVYGWTKLQGEQYLRYFARQRGLEAVATRLFNVVGPGETNPHLMPEIVAQLKSGIKSVKLGNIWPKRDYIDVEDAAAGFRAAALDGLVARGEVVTANLGTSRQYSVAEMLDHLRNVAGIEFTVEQDPARMRPVDRAFLGADNTRMREQFGWTPAHSIESSLQRLWREPNLTPQLMAKYKLQDKAA